MENYDICVRTVDMALQAHATIWTLIREQQEQIKGKKPFSVADLKKAGMAWANNWNFFKAHAKISKGVGENIGRIQSALGFCTPRFRLGDPETDKDKWNFLLDEEKRSIISSLLGYIFAETLSKDTRMTMFYNATEYPSYAFGFCAVTYKPDDWLPVPVSPLAIAFEDHTKSDTVNTWVVLHEEKAQALYEHYVRLRNRKIREEESGVPSKVKSGWKIEALEAILAKAYMVRNGEKDNEPMAWEEILDQYNSCPGLVCMNTHNIKIAKIYTRELNGGFTETYIAYNNDWNKEETIKGRIYPEVAAILYQKHYKNYNQEEHFALIRDSGFGENESIQDMRGVAKYAVEDGLRYQRHRNSFLNKLFFMGMPFFMRSNTQSGSNFQLVVAQGYVLLPEGAVMPDKQPMYDVRSHMEAIRFEENEYMRDTQQFNSTVSDRLSTRPTSEEIQLRNNEQGRISGTKSFIKLNDYRPVFEQIFKRLGSLRMNPSDPGYQTQKRFFKRIRETLPLICKTESDCRELIKQVEELSMEATNMDIAALREAAVIAETPFARNRFKRMLLLAMGHSIIDVNLAVPIAGFDPRSTEAGRVAMFENADFMNTSEVAILQTDDHITHLSVHFARIDSTFQAITDQKLDIIDGFKYLGNILGHCNQHIQFVANDPLISNQLEEIAEKFGQYMQGYEKLRGMAEAQIQSQMEQAGQVPIDPETQANIQRKNMEAQAKQERTNYLTRGKMVSNQAKMETEAALKNREIELKHERELEALRLENERLRSKQLQTE